MKNLIKKYRLNQLTTPELNESKAKANAFSDDELAAEISKDWNEFEPGSQLTDKQAETAVFNRIAAEHLQSHRLRTNAWRYLRVACAIAIPLLLCTTIYFYHMAHNPAPMSTSMTTGPADIATVTLPDGSVIDLNGSSVLKYDMTEFSSGRRDINFEGEGYFNIAKNPDSRFTIHIPGLEVTVLGTSFNLQARPEANQATIYLIDGRVALTSTTTHETVELRPNEKAILDRTSGQFTVSDINSNDNPTAWKSHKLFFKNAGLPVVISQLEKTFRCTITYPDNISNEHFTGLIPTRDLTEALSVLEKTFNTKLTVVMN